MEAYPDGKEIDDTQRQELIAQAYKLAAFEHAIDVQPDFYRVKYDNGDDFISIVVPTIPEEVDNPDFSTTDELLIIVNSNTSVIGENVSVKNRYYRIGLTDLETDYKEDIHIYDPNSWQVIDTITQVDNQRITDDRWQKLSIIFDSLSDDHLVVGRR
jgi:hypothetical protein